MNEGLNKKDESNLENKEIKKLVGIYQDSEDLTNAYCITEKESWDGKILPDKHASGFLMNVYENGKGQLFKLDGTPIEKLGDAYEMALGLLKK